MTKISFPMKKRMGKEYEQDIHKRKHEKDRGTDEK